jgi:4-carboxymuconolactone decarboxylase
MSDTSNFGTFGRFVETPLDDMPPEMKEAYDAVRELRGLVPGPHKIWLANPALAKTIVPTGAYFQRESTLTKAEIEIATNIVNGRWRSPYATTNTRSSVSVTGIWTRDVLKR